MVTRRLFLGFLSLLALQRWLELRLSKRNEERILENGGVEHNPGAGQSLRYAAIRALDQSWTVRILTLSE